MKKAATWNTDSKASGELQVTPKYPRNNDAVVEYWEVIASPACSSIFYKHGKRADTQYEEPLNAVIQV